MNMWTETHSIAQDAFARLMGRQTRQTLANWQTNREVLQPAVQIVLEVMPNELLESLAPNCIDHPLPLPQSANDLQRDAAEIARLVLAARVRDVALGVADIQLGQTGDPGQEYPRLAWITAHLLATHVPWPFQDEPPTKPD
jgi:hypothetical protein